MQTIVRGAAMEVGLSVLFQNTDGSRTDHQVYRNELRLAELAEPLGFDSVWTTEHHFTDYMLCPDPLQFLTYMAAKTTRIKLGSMVVVLPWHDPLRVAENLAVLDTISEGRVVFGIGRGAGDVEFDGFRVPMSESRERFMEAATMVLNAMETGEVVLDGQHYKQPKVALRPAPFKSFKGRSYAATLSPESSELMAKLGLGILIIPQKPWDQAAKDLESYRAIYRGVHGNEAPPTIASAWVYCDKDEKRAEEMAKRYVAEYYRSTIRHYKFDGKHFGKTKGYEYYDRISKNLEKSGGDAAADFFVGLQVWGTPEQCREKIWNIQEKVGCNAFNAVFSYAGMPYEAAEQSLRLFASEVMPRVQRGA
jgi:alkanesulfonate monooxygenase SsuD/methylene tetrahydromethanopterin reductase-like flavin-dependent oxidoreductase (luciferase family)